MDNFVTTLTNVVNAVNGVVWGPLMLALILGTGLYLMIGLSFYPLKNIRQGFKLLFTPASNSSQEGEISPFRALMTSLSATIGTGNIAGVATAIYFGGPGALFWMWCTALVGMATKYAEAVCAVHYREVDSNGHFSGGPMYYIKNGLGPKWRWLAVCFAVFGALAGFGIGDAVQANTVASTLENTFGIDKAITSIALMVLVGAVILGGVKRIAHVASVLVPFMAVTYFSIGLLIIFLNFSEIPALLIVIVDSALTGSAVEGGFIGAAVMLAIRWGVARGIFSNEAGLGSAPIAHAAARTNSPVRQGTIAMLGTFIDTLVVCSITGFVILLSGLYTPGSELNGVALTSAAFKQGVPGGDYIVSLGLIFFAFTTIIGWSYYSERCAVFIFGPKIIMPFRILWLVAIPLGALSGLQLVWNIADTLNAMMALPNLIALLLLSPVIFKLTRQALANGVE